MQLWLYSSHFLIYISNSVYLRALMTKQKSCMHLTVWRNCLWVWEKKKKIIMGWRVGNPEYGLSGTILFVLNGAKSELWFQWACMYNFTLWMSLNFIFISFATSIHQGKRGLLWLQVQTQLNTLNFSLVLKHCAILSYYTLCAGFTGVAEC